MATLSDLGRRLTPLTEPDIDWLHALVSDWQLLADLSFADLVLWAPLRDGSGWVALAQMRPTTGPTALPRRHGRHRARRRASGPSSTPRTHEQRICREGDPEWTARRPGPARVHPGGPRAAGHRGDRAQHQSELGADPQPPGADLPKGADDLAQMVAAGTFPYPGQEPALVRSPRVGDGLLRLGRSGRVSYASPNALSAYRRLGLTADLVGAELGPLTAGLCCPRACPPTTR